MKKVSNLNDALAYLLQRLVDAEKLLGPAIINCSRKANDAGLKRALTDYARSTHDKIQKLERIFSYLLWEPGDNRNLVVRRMIHDTKALLQATTSDQTRDAMLLACVQNINFYKMSGYKTTLAFAIALQLDTVSDLLKEILHWEQETNLALTKLALEEVSIGAIREESH